jgi:2-oxoglutarate ferredoxin oxidoreductase subunit delta
MKKATIKIDKNRCKSCQLCLLYCKQKCLVVSSEINAMGFHPVEYTGNGCIGCTNCALICPDVVIEVYREE